MAAKLSSYPFEWVRPEQCVKPVGPFGRSKLYELLKAGVFISKNIHVGTGKRTLTLISLKSINDFLNGPGLPTSPGSRKPKAATKMSNHKPASPLSETINPLRPLGQQLSRKTNEAA